MMNKYSQSNQDNWVLSIIKHKGYFVDMGAYDFELYSNTLKLAENGWHGILIEPNPKAFQKSIGSAFFHKITAVNCAIATYNGVLKMSDEDSSTQRNDNGVLEIPCYTIETIFKEYKVPNYIDYISSDLERMDADVWESFPFDEYSFGLATVEHCLYEGNNNFKERIMKVMLDNGYVLAKENVEHDGSKYEDWYSNKDICL
jgi:FkbM family methyltransferase